jgi:large subunit ribosomal protein L14e
MFEIGRLCLKTAGREAGNYCVIIKKMDEGFVMVTGPKSLTRVKRRKCNINHLEPIEEMVNIKSDASDVEVLKAYQQASILARLGLEKGKKPKGHKIEKKTEPEKHEKKKEHKPEHKEMKTKPKKDKPKKTEKKHKVEKKSTVKKTKPAKKVKKKK